MGIFTSSRRLEFDMHADANTVFKHFASEMKPRTFGRVFTAQLSPTGEYIGRREGNVVKIEYRHMVNNSLRPTMCVTVQPVNDKDCHISTRYETSVAVKIFFFVWIAFATAIAFSIFSVKHEILTMLFPIGGLGVLALMRVVAKYDENHLETFVRRILNDATFDAHDPITEL